MLSEKTAENIESAESGASITISEPENTVPKEEKRWWLRLYRDPWFQIVLISLISFCNPGMYNALTGMGGSGQVDTTVAANSNVATHACTAGFALLFVGAFYKYIGPRVSLILGGWTYALYGGSLLNYNRTSNGAFVIAAGALLGLGAALFWVAQGTIMVSYTNEQTRGRAIALFWVIFNLGGAVGSLASFGINYHSSSGTVTDSTYVAYIVIMLFGWTLSVLVCPAESLSTKYSGFRLKKEATHVDWQNLKKTILKTLVVIADWRVALLYPMFYNANIFYSYQQNAVNAQTFNLRTRSLNGALYWIAQMVGGLIIGFLLDFKRWNKRHRAIAGWTVLFVTGMAIWGGGYQFQKWSNARLSRKLKQDIDYKDGSIYLGPMFLYFFYGMYDSFWQGFCYWIIGAQSNSPVVNAIIVGTYSALKPAGGAMAWRINAEGVSAMKQFAMNWGITIGSLVVAIPTIFLLKLNNDLDQLEADEIFTTREDSDKIEA